MGDDNRDLLKKIPKMDEIISILQDTADLKNVKRAVIVKSSRSVLNDLRSDILAGNVNEEPDLKKIAAQIYEKISGMRGNSLRRVINATGIVLHTNLGRAPLPLESVENIAEVSCGYCNLEYDLQTGKRGLRYDHIREMLCELTGADDALVVNNNAAAVLLILNSLSEGLESIVSRGELIEIGGEFRLPEIMKKSGAILREVGTTNRTHLNDYEKAINENTALLMKVHPSNYRIIGFSEEVSLSDLIILGGKRGIPVVNDLGSGCFEDLERFGLEKEPTVQEVIKAGTDVVTFSGDKLLCGPQAGIILGKKDLLARVKSNHLNRALRIDKMTIAALESTLKVYLEENPSGRLRALKALTESANDVGRRARKLLNMLRKKITADYYIFDLKKGSSLAGGGSLPTREVATFLVTVKSPRLSAARIEERLRKSEIPVIARIIEDAVVFDLRTIVEGEFTLIAENLQKIADA